MTGRRGALALLAAGLLLAGCGGTVVAPAGPAVTANSEARIFVEPDDGPEPLLKELQAATASIDVEVYLLTDASIRSTLEQAERRGVRVRVLLEQHPFGETVNNDASYAALQRAGVAARWTNPRFKLTHEKAAVVDGREALILTFNLSVSAFTRNREYGVVVRDPGAVAEVQAIFNADWDRSAYSPTRPDLVVSPDNSRARLMALIAQAGQTLDLESEEIQDQRLEDALVEAHQRGVQVRTVISPAESGSDPNQKGVQRLTAGGVQVHELRKPYIHAKIVIADRQTAFAGSENISGQSLDANRELGLFLSEPASVSRMRATFEADWNSH